jgi:hypothetical protein
VGLETEVRDRRLEEKGWKTEDKNGSSTIVIPGLTRNPDSFHGATLLDAGSVIPVLIRDRHDGNVLSAFGRAGVRVSKVKSQPVRTPSP